MEIEEESGYDESEWEEENLEGEGGYFADEEEEEEDTEED
jgi:hypothetical protein